MLTNEEQEQQNKISSATRTAKKMSAQEYGLETAYQDIREAVARKLYANSGWNSVYSKRLWLARPTLFFPFK